MIVPDTLDFANRRSGTWLSSHLGALKLFTLSLPADVVNLTIASASPD